MGSEKMASNLDMIGYARERIPELHVAFHLTKGVRIPLPDSSAAAVFSTHVFQHFDRLDHHISPRWLEC